MLAWVHDLSASCCFHKQQQHVGVR